MEILLSGLNEEVCCKLVGATPAAVGPVHWCPPAELVERLAHRTDSVRAIWFYRAPWSLENFADPGDDAVIRDTLALWLQQNRNVLNARGLLVAGAELLLVNADRVSPAALRAELESHGSAGDAATNSPTDSFRNVDAFGKLFEWIAPGYWDVFEALEAAAWLPGDEPLFRNTVAPDEDCLVAVLRTMRDGTLLASANNEIQRLREAAEGSDSAHRELKQENELFLIQLHQVQEELEQYYLKNVELTKTLEKGSTAAASAQGEIKALKAQLGRMQEELKREQQKIQELQPAAEPPKPVVAQASTGNGMGTTSDSEAFAAPILPRATRPLARLIPGTARKAFGKSRNRRMLRVQLARIEKSGWFDRRWYLDTYPDVRAARIDPVEHYFTVGWKENRNPGARFDTAYYLQSNPDIQQSGLNPLWHFIEFGRKEGRLPRKS